jgi:16S rRNA (uracil1498-N3)-methyltransferase
LSALWVHVEELAGGDRVSLGADEVRHVGSRRLREGDALVAFDGRGATAPARVVRLARSSVEIELAEVERHAPIETGFVLASAIPKGERLSTMLSMLVQLGLECWQPLVLEDSAVRRIDVEAPRLRRIVIEGCKVARRPWAMRLLPPLGLDEALDRRPAEAAIYHGDREGGAVGIEAGPGWLFIGPEAGFSDRERARLAAAGAKACQLGTHNLRIETAAIAGAVAHFLARAGATEGGRGHG